MKPLPINESIGRLKVALDAKRTAALDITAAREEILLAVIAAFKPFDVGISTLPGCDVSLYCRAPRARQDDDITFYFAGSNGLDVVLVLQSGDAHKVDLCKFDYDPGAYALALLESE